MYATSVNSPSYSSHWNVSTTSSITDLTENRSSETPNATKCTFDEQSLNGVLAVSYTITFIIGLLGNILALYAFLKIHKKRNSIQVYLLNIAIADLLLIFCLPFRIMYVTQNKWMLGLTFCRVVGNLFYMNMYISIILLGMISMDRYVKITRALQKHKMSRTKCSIYICSILWVFSIAAVIPMIAHNLRKQEQQPNLCFHYRDRQQVIWKAVFNYFLVIAFWIVFLLLILSYVKIAKNLLDISKERSHLPNSAKYNKTAHKSLVVLLIFTVCFVPYHTFRFFYITSQLQETSCYWKEIIHKTNEIMVMFSVFNSCLDPVMYFMLSNSVRKTVFQLICRVYRESSRSESITSECQQGHSLASAHAVFSSSTTTVQSRYLIRKGS